MRTKRAIWARLAASVQVAAATASQITARLVEMMEENNVAHLADVVGTG